MKPLSLYVHFPYCLSKCGYCDFNSFGMTEDKMHQEEYVSSLLREIHFWNHQLKSTSSFYLKTIYFGGGTPSLMRPESVKQVLDHLSRLWKVDRFPEITLEVNPKTVTLSKIKSFLNVGINRLSIGVQTLQDKLLAGLGRTHQSKDALQTMEWAFAAGFKNVSVDLMYGLPDQNLGDFRRDLEMLFNFPITHLSAYALTLEEHTPMFDAFCQGSLDLPSEDAQIEMETYLLNFVKKFGFSPYEISNYAQEAYCCQHNLTYWNYQPYLGIGAGAVGFLSWELLREEWRSRTRSADHSYGVRVSNPCVPEDYKKGADLKEAKDWEIIDHKTSRSEFMMMGLRTHKGIAKRDFQDKFGVLFDDIYGEIGKKLREQGFLQDYQGVVSLTAKGRNLASEVSQAFFI